MTNSPEGVRLRRRGTAYLCVFLPLLFLGACEQQTAAPELPPPAVTVVVAAQKDITPSFEFIGRVEAIDKVDLRARVEGVLEERLFTEGDYVEKGQLLFVIEKGLYEAAVEMAKADVAQAEATLIEANLKLKRVQDAVQTGAVSAQELDQAVAAQKRAEAEVMAAEAALRRAQLDLGYTEVKAPVRGKIGRAAYTVGNLVGPESGSLAHIVSIDPIYVNFPVSQRDVLELQRERLASGPDMEKLIVPTLRLSDGEPYQHPGELDFIDPRVDPETDTRMVRVVFANPDELLVDGQFVTVVLRREERIRKLVVPQAAVQQDQAGPFVVVVTPDNKAEIRRVETGLREGVDWVIEAGLSDGELVIVEGLQKVRPGSTVKPSLAAAAAAEG